MSYDKTQEEATNRLLLDMVKNQREYISRLFKAFVITLVCYTLILVSMIVGFFVYEAQSEGIKYENVVTQDVADEYNK